MNANMIVNDSEQEPMNKSWNEMLVQQSQWEPHLRLSKIGPQRLAEKAVLESKYSFAEKFPLIHLSSTPFPPPHPPLLHPRHKRPDSPQSAFIFPVSL